MHALLLPAMFVTSMFLSLVFKQLISFIYFDAGSVWEVFIGEINHRMHGDHQGSAISPLVALETQFKRYYFAVLDWRAAAEFLKFSGTWGWLVVVFLAAWAALRHRAASPISDLLAFGLIGSVVIARYLIMANHSQIHTIFVSRYLFLFLSITWAAILWFTWSIADKKTGSSG